MVESGLDNARGSAEMTQASMIAMKSSFFSESRNALKIVMSNSGNKSFAEVQSEAVASVKAIASKYAEGFMQDGVFYRAVYGDGGVGSQVAGTFAYIATNGGITRSFSEAQNFFVDMEFNPSNNQLFNTQTLFDKFTRHNQAIADQKSELAELAKLSSEIKSMGSD